MLNIIPKSFQKAHSKQFNHQTMQADINLHPQMLQRIAELEQALKFELMLRRISDKVRASLDENYILQAAVTELALELEADCFATLALNMEQQTSISHPPTLTSIPDCQTGIISPTSNPEIDQPLRQGRYVHFCSNTSSFQERYTFFACPIVNGSENLANLWVIRDISRTLEDYEIYLVQQVANQCAISIHQSRLYESAQKHVEELNRLNEVKEDFLIRMTHDLREPLSNMQLSIHLLEHQLTEGHLRCGHISQQDFACSKTFTYVKILQLECEAEIRLINDLRDLQKLEAGKLPLDVCEIDLENWRKELVETLEERMQQRQLILELLFPSSLPALISEPGYLHHIMSEVLHNA
ncbi:histidine kinase dimerization/phospho-acceptor domain-containing protein [Microcoleus sp. T3_B1]|uniref:GAF domain-containing protein n=1 Tax=Microcoleus sp. T3_B1 TaxID=3055425 RepID=UPI002FD4DA31